MFFHTAYDDLGLPLYITGLDSYEVLYINGEGKKLFGDITGRKCYEALNGTRKACGVCISSRYLEEYGPSRTKSRYLAAVGKHVDTFENVISLPDGSKGRLCLIVDVTEQERIKQENKAREKARRDMQHLIDIQSGFIRSAKSMMCAATMDEIMIFANQTMTETLGFSQKEILRMRVRDFYPPHIAQDFMEKSIPQALAEGASKGDSLIYKKDGSCLPVRHIVFPIRNEAGENIAIAAIMDDISKVLEMERMNRYQLAIMNSSTSYIGVSDLEGNTMYHSPGAYRMLGYEPGEPERWDKRAYYPDWYWQRVFTEGIPTAMTEGQWIGRGELIDRYGKHIPVEQTIFPVFDEDHQLMGTATIVQDITKQVKQEREIEAGRRTLRAIIDTTPSSIFWKDKDSCFLGANKQFAHDVGLDNPAKLIGLSDYDLYPREIADKYTASDRKIFETGTELFHVEKPLPGAGGITHWVSTSKVLIHDSSGEPYALLGIYDDITRQKQNEMKLEEAIRAAEEASRAKSDFLSRMSHEIRTPMNAILGMTKIGQGANDTERMQYCFEKIDGASKHLLGLINDILDMSKIEANKLELIEEPFDFEKMLENICNVINVKTEEKAQTLLVNMHESVPAEIIADEMRISQVITNLLSNAVKFTPEKGTITLSASADGETEDGRLRLTVSVADNGIGLTKEQTGKLFNSFEQAEAVTSRKYGGTGLGLAISKRIVELMDGEVSVSSKINEGSVFTFTIPVSKSSKLGQAPYSPADYRDARVLVVDDSWDILEYFQRLLGKKGISCDLADSGAAAVEMVAKGLSDGAPYNIMFVDYLMEDMDGVETTRKIRALAGDSINIAMISQAEWEAIEETAKIAGVNKFISKPLFQSPILNCIDQFIFPGGQDTAQAPTNKGIFRGSRMLLAEDIDINREIVISLLADTGISIECAMNGEEAVAMFAAQPGGYDLIMMDVQMPMMDGLEATRRIRELKMREARDIPIIAMTANAFAEDVDACKKAGMVDHIGKPIDLDILIEKIRKYLPPEY